MNFTMVKKGLGLVVVLVVGLTISAFGFIGYYAINTDDLCSSGAYVALGVLLMASFFLIFGIHFGKCDGDDMPTMTFKEYVKFRKKMRKQNGFKNTYRI